MRGPRSWSTRSSERLFDHPLLSLERRRLESRDDDSSDGSGDSARDALVLEAPDWVNVVALAHDAGGEPRVVLVRQWRYASEEMTLEIPGGMVDPGESSAAAAARELYEETGYRSASLEQIGVVRPNPALFANRCTTFVATDLTCHGRPEGDGEEEIEVVLVPMSRVPAMIASGEIDHALVVAAFHFLDLHPRSAAP